MFPLDLAAPRAADLRRRRLGVLDRAAVALRLAAAHAARLSGAFFGGPPGAPDDDAGGGGGGGWPVDAGGGATDGPAEPSDATEAAAAAISVRLQYME